MTQPLEWCRERLPKNSERCNEPAILILWGRYFPPEGLGPRCYNHAAKHIGAAGMSRLDQYAVFDLRKVTRR